MQMFGLISIMIVIALGATWAVSNMGREVDNTGVIQESDYRDALDSARDAVGSI